MPRSAVSTAVDGLVAACEQFSSALDMASTLDFTAKFEGAFGDIGGFPVKFVFCVGR